MGAVTPVPQQALIPPPPTPQVSAMTTFNVASIDPGLEAALSCVEGAIQMYRNIPPDLSSGMLVAVRAALLNAASKCTVLIEDDVKNDFVQIEELDSADCSPMLTTE